MNKYGEPFHSKLKSNKYAKKSIISQWNNKKFIKCTFFNGQLQYFPTLLFHNDIFIYFRRLLYFLLFYFNSLYSNEGAWLSGFGCSRRKIYQIHPADLLPHHILFWNLCLKLSIVAGKSTIEYHSSCVLLEGRLIWIKFVIKFIHLVLQHQLCCHSYGFVQKTRPAQITTPLNLNMIKLNKKSDEITVALQNKSVMKQKSRPLKNLHFIHLICFSFF